MRIRAHRIDYSWRNIAIALIDPGELLKHGSYEGGHPGSRRMDRYFNCFSIAAITSFESGVTAGSKR